MKTFLTLLTLFLCLVFAAAAQDVDKLPLITVTGTAEVLVAPDQVIFSLDVTKTNKELQTAKNESDTAIKKVLDLAKRFSVEPKDVKTDYISVEMKYDVIRDAKVRVYDEDGDETGKKIFKGYEVSTTVIIKLKDMARVEEFFGEALKTGITEVNSVKFETSKLRENKDQARDMALKAAKEKARDMAAAIGQGIGKAVKITEGTVPNRDYSLSANINSNSISAGTGSFSESVASFAPGAIKIEAQVIVSFILN